MYVVCVWLCVWAITYRYFCHCVLWETKSNVFIIDSSSSRLAQWATDATAAAVTGCVCLYVRFYTLRVCVSMSACAWCVCLRMCVCVHWYVTTVTHVCISSVCRAASLLFLEQTVDKCLQKKRGVQFLSEIQSWIYVQMHKPGFCVGKLKFSRHVSEHHF